jgi:plastocyanin
VNPSAWPLSATITLTATGPQPESVIINVGGRVTFLNNDVRAHDMVSDPDLRHDECPPLNRVGFLSPGQRRESGVFESVQSCGFHDHLEPTQFTGRVDVRW